MKISNTAERLLNIMQENNLRQIDILKMCAPYCKKYNIKLGRNDLSQYVNGKVEPGQEKLSILSMALNVSEAWLMGYDVPQSRGTIISAPHSEIADDTLSAIKILAYQSGYEFSFFANQFQIKYNDCIIKLSPKDVDNLTTSSIEHINFVMNSIITNRLKDNKFSINSDLKISENILNAAHKLSNSSPDTQKNDDDIMDDENF